MVLALHDPARALSIGTRIIGIRAGRIVLDRPTQGLTLPELHALYEG